jgi:hypothetical protein
MAGAATQDAFSTFDIAVRHREGAAAVVRRRQSVTGDRPGRDGATAP